ncbi:hypothetical protein V6N13_014169 [Hibiscus sabdariffa]
MFALVAAIVVLLQLPEPCIARTRHKHCTPIICGNLTISYPFRLTTQPRNCGHHEFELDCNSNNRTILAMNLGRYTVQTISYQTDKIRVVDANIATGDCSLPRSYFWHYGSHYFTTNALWSSSIYLVNCTRPIESSTYIFSDPPPALYAYFLDGRTSFQDFDESCTIEALIPVMTQNISGFSTSDIYEKLLLHGFELSYHYHTSDDPPFAFFSILGIYLSKSFAGDIVLDRTCGIEMAKKTPRMSCGFRDKLGEGGYGSVYKGKLRSGYLVAIKMLENSKGNGEDFINEVATIGRIHHVNVMKLIGFCVEGSKQALVYDFMSNGSLDQIIFGKENKIDLSWEKKFDIALGVARGIDYLHQGCDMQILHFDIKPHNILLDENFVPRVADFGLAKLYPVDDSIVSLTQAQDTMGYIVPELIYKNLDDMDWRDITNVEKIVVRKMVMIASWCVPLKPNDRPSMRKVLEMSETDVELLQMLPRPFQLPHEISTEDQSLCSFKN